MLGYPILFEGFSIGICPNVQSRMRSGTELAFDTADLRNLPAIAYPISLPKPLHSQIMTPNGMFQILENFHSSDYCRFDLQARRWSFRSCVERSKIRSVNFWRLRIGPIRLDRVIPILVYGNTTRLRTLSMTTGWSCLDAKDPFFGDPYSVLEVPVGFVSQLAPWIASAQRATLTRRSISYSRTTIGWYAEHQLHKHRATARRTECPTSIKHWSCILTAALMLCLGHQNLWSDIW